MQLILSESEWKVKSEESQGHAGFKTSQNNWIKTENDVLKLCAKSGSEICYLKQNSIH